jgi:hypothetical protein
MADAAYPAVSETGRIEKTRPYQNGLKTCAFSGRFTLSMGNGQRLEAQSHCYLARA